MIIIDLMSNDLGQWQIFIAVYLMKHFLPVIFVVKNIFWF